MTLTFKIQLRNITKPPVWRRIVIPADFTFHQLHHTIQEAFGWEDYHLYQFQQQPYDGGWQVCEPNPEADFGVDGMSIDSRRQQVGAFLKQRKLQKLVYVYDFGDDWIHDLTLEKTDPDATLLHPKCLAGKGACPPEDCGGPWGYAEIKRLLAEEPESDEAQEYVEWMGFDDAREFDPKEFSLNEVNIRLWQIGGKPKGKLAAMVEKEQAAETDGDDNLFEDFRKLVEQMKDMADNMSDEEFESFRSVLTGKTALPEVENERFYRYQKPDYESKSARTLSWLGPFWNAQNDDDKLELCEFVEADGRKQQLSKKEMNDEMRGYMYRLFARFDPEEPGNRWRLLGPLWMMEHLKMTDCLDLALEALRQDAYFVYAYILRFEEWPSAAIYQLGCKRPDVLEKFLYEQGLIPSVKPVVFNALVWCLLRQPQQRLRITAMLTKFMNHCYDICKQGASAMNLEQYAITLATAHVKETLPILKRIFEDIHFPTMVLTEGYDEVERTMNDPKVEFCCKYSSIDQYLRDKDELDEMDFADEMGNSFFDYLSDDEEDDEDFDDDDLDDYDEFDDDDDEFDDDEFIEGFYDVTEKPQRYEVTVEHAQAWRLLQIPSNMTLDGVAQLLAKAFGMKKLPEAYEFQNVAEPDFRYVSNEEDYALDEDYWALDGTDYSCLREVLTTRGEMAELRLKKGKKTIDVLTLTLQKKGRYTAKTPHAIELLAASDEADGKALEKIIRKFEDDNPLPEYDDR